MSRRRPACLLAVVPSTRFLFLVVTLFAVALGFDGVDMEAARTLFRAFVIGRWDPRRLMVDSVAVARATARTELSDARTPARGPLTLGVDVGGSNVKASVLDRDGSLAAERTRMATPVPATPAAVLQCILALAARLPSFDRISVGFPGVVKGGRVITAPNLGTEYWSGFNLIDALASRFSLPVRILNDAAVHGLGVVEGRGLACAVTLGTGIGCALFRSRRLLLHLEFGQSRRGDETYDQFIGQAALEAIGPTEWNVRVGEALRAVMELTTCDVLYVGGGNARKITCALPEQVRIVSNAAGITGGVRLWEPELDELFEGEPNAQRGYPSERSR
jgi:polyphosphate glucokinase